MHLRARAALLAVAVLAAVASSAGPALAGAGGPGFSHGAARDQALTWSVVSSPNRSARDNQLNGVSCVSASSCTAVGYTSNKHEREGTLVESWNGTSWSIVPSRNKGLGNELNDVSCVSASSCTAVGYTSDKAIGERTLVESWNGASWSIVPSPSTGPPKALDELDGVSCVSASACTAVGDSFEMNISRSSEARTLIESWDGTAWSVVPSPNPGTGLHRPGDYLHSVSCTAAAACTAVGIEYSGSRRHARAQTLVESWNGTAWSVVPSPNKGSAGSALFGVSCTSMAACTAVGSYDGSNPGQLVESWDGANWSIVPSPKTAGGTLTSVACPSPSTCTTVGFDYARGATLVESWDGSTWSVVPSPGVGGENTDDFLWGVACPSPTMCTGVGDFLGPYRNRTLVETGLHPARAGKAVRFRLEHEQYSR